MRSIFAAITAAFIKIPAENALLMHIQFLRELLEHGVLLLLVWVGTRDMLADGTTKGSVDRSELHRLMKGEVKVQHEPKVWMARHARTSKENKTRTHLVFLQLCGLAPCDLSAVCSGLMWVPAKRKADETGGETYEAAPQVGPPFVPGPRDIRYPTEAAAKEAGRVQAEGPSAAAGSSESEAIPPSRPRSGE